MAQANRQQRRAAQSKRAAPARSVQQTPQIPAAGQIPVINYVVFAFINHTGGIKIAVNTHEEGVKLLAAVNKNLALKKPYFNQEKGILVSPSNFSHAFMTQEQVPLSIVRKGNPLKDANQGNPNDNGNAASEQSGEATPPANVLEDMAG